MYYPEELIEEIRLQNDIVDVVSSYVHLTKKGGSYFGLCPFHNEKTPSFSVSPDKQIYYCFGCGAGGNVITFAMEYENYTFPEAVKMLADRVNIPLPEPEVSEKMKKELSYKQLLLDANKEAARYFYYQLGSDKGKAALKYLISRGIGEDLRKKFGLGYSPMFRDDLYQYLKHKGFDDDVLVAAGLSIKDKNGPDGYHDRFFNRVMFPIFDVHNRVIAFGGRVLGDGEPKYLNSPETKLFDKSRNLYGLNLARQARKKNILIVEGYMDVIAMHQAGFTNSVASLGTSLTTGQASLLRRYVDEVILAYDSDKAGIGAALRAIPLLKGANLSVRILTIPDAKDPDEYIKKYGAEQFEMLLATAVPSFMFEVEQAARKYNMKDPEHKIRFNREVASMLLTFGSEVERDSYLDAVCDLYPVKRKGMEQMLSELGKNVGIAATGDRDSMDAGPRKRETKDTLSRARKDILTLIAGHADVYEAVRDHLKPEEFIDPFFSTMASLIFEGYRTGEPLKPASIINRFDTVDEQNMAAAIFNNALKIESPQQFEKMLNGNIKLVKTAYIEELSRELTDPGKMQELILLKKEMQTFHISLE